MGVRDLLPDSGRFSSAASSCELWQLVILSYPLPPAFISVKDAGFFNISRPRECLGSALENYVNARMMWMPHGISVEERPNPLEDSNAGKGCSLDPGLSR